MPPLYSAQAGIGQTAQRLSGGDHQSNQRDGVAAQDHTIKDARIEQQSRRIAELDRQANPQRYRLSSGAELVKINIPNYNNPSLHIWTRVGEEKFDDVKFQIDYNLAQQHFNNQITDEELVNAVFEPQEQVSQAQIDLLGAAFMLATAGPAQTRVGTGSGGSHSDLPWDDKNNTRRKR